jgi:glycosyltransferase involved in cell wall biosynthesis
VTRIMHSSCVIQEFPRYNPRALPPVHPAIGARITSLNKLDYVVKGHEEHSFLKDEPVFTLILTVYNGRESFVREAVQSVFSQTYRNTEVILVDNGSSGVVAKIIDTAFVSNPNSKLLRLGNHHFSPDLSEFENPIPNLWNAGLLASEGDYVYFQSYDDVISPNYVETMVALFEGNERCETAAPEICSIGENSELNVETTENLRRRNNRRRYESGIDLALSVMRGEPMLAAPGGFLAQKSMNVIRGGGFDNFNDWGQIFRFAITGDSGFDPGAQLLWRHHHKQANKVQKSMGLVYYRQAAQYLEDFDIFSLHTGVVGAEFASEFVMFWLKLAEENAKSSLRDSFRLYGLRAGLKAFRRVVEECPHHVVLWAVSWIASQVPLLVFRSKLPRAFRLMKKIRDFWNRVKLGSS